MLRFVAIVRPQRAEAVCRELLATQGVHDLEVVEVMGSNRGVDKVVAAPFAIEALPMARIAGIAAEEIKATVIESVLGRGRTGRYGDGKVFFVSACGWFEGA